MSKPYNEEKDARFNDGGVDPQGRLYAGSMGTGKSKKHVGELLRCENSLSLFHASCLKGSSAGMTLMARGLKSSRLEKLAVAMVWDGLRMAPSYVSCVNILALCFR